jgi:hypothetical protein
MDPKDNVDPFAVIIAVDNSLPDESGVDSCSANDITHFCLDTTLGTVEAFSEPLDSPPASP